MDIELNMSDVRRKIQCDIHIANIHAHDKAFSLHEQNRRAFNGAELG